MSLVRPVDACVGCHTAVSNASTAALTWSIAK